jgi:hypothetical protein
MELKDYSAKYDAYYNVQTGEWIEEKCNYAECKYCKNRPDTAWELAKSGKK